MRVKEFFETNYPKGGRAIEVFPPRHAFGLKNRQAGAGFILNHLSTSFDPEHSGVKNQNSIFRFPLSRE